MIARLPLVLKTCRKLGALSVARVAGYRIASKSGLYRRLLPVCPWSGGSIFLAPAKHIPSPNDLPSDSRDTIKTQAMSLLEGRLDYFSHLNYQVGSPPDWFLDPISGNRLADSGHWSNLNEFSKADIKIVWEASRFEWVPLFARAWRVSGDNCYLEALNSWLHDWTVNNPLNSGPNWKCGQEASIRTINLLLAALLTGTHQNPSNDLVTLIQQHCSRILPTISYALAQDNNHGTSEAAALYIGGLWLLDSNAPLSRDLRYQAHTWHSLGKRLLEDRVTRLVAGDGSFSQYSVNYHRVLLDTLCQVEIWRRKCGDEPFSSTYRQLSSAAVDWLNQLTDGISGDAPNFGANDGARLYGLACTPYRDFRPTIQLASVLFNNSKAYRSGVCDEPLLWLDLNSAPYAEPVCTGFVVHKSGGDVILRGDNCHAMIRFAAFRFRPSHADCLHLDLWHNGSNILRDGGTYSYNTDPEWLDYFSGTRSHNTIQFDDRNQMPRLGRFLFGNWLEMDECGDVRNHNGQLEWTGAYTDWKGSAHRRSVNLDRTVLRVVDEIQGFNDKAILRWRLAPDLWRLEDTVCSSDLAELRIITAAPFRRLEIVTGWESRYYQQKTELRVLEVEVPAGHWTITTEITLKD